MTVKDIVIDALRKIGRDDVASEMESGGEPSGEKGETVKTLLYCVNAAEDELARYYFPLRRREKLSSESGEYPFASFSRMPIKILGVWAGGKKVTYELTLKGLNCPEKEIDIEYFYAPAKKDMDGESEFGTLADGKITSLGAAAEYCLICGENSMAAVWEERYRSAIDRARNRIDKGAYIPPRRWI